MFDDNRGYQVAALGAVGALTFVAFGTGVFLGSSYGPSHEQYEALGGSQGTRKTYQGVTESLPDIALIPKPVERAMANPPSDGGQDSIERDLAAQESMAVWAFYMALAAYGTMFVTFVGTLLIWIQVRLTRIAVKDTGDATKAMERQIGLMELAQEREKEPRLMVSIVDGVRARPGQDKGLFVDGNALVAKISSVGPGDATLTGIHRQWAKGKSSEVFSPDFYPIEPDGLFTKRLSIPLAGDGIQIATFSEDAPLGDLDETTYFYGWVEYERARGAQLKYVTGFCYAFIPRIPERGLITGLPSNSDAFWFHRELNTD